MNKVGSREKGAGRSIAECFGCGKQTAARYRDLPLCVHCQQEAMLLNQLYALPSELPAKTAARKARELAWFLRGRELGELVRRLALFMGAAVFTCALVYIGWKLGDALLAWLRLAGVS